MLVVLIILTGIMMSLYVLSRKKYDGIIDGVSEKEFPLRRLFPVVFYLFDLFNYSYNTSYDRKILSLIIELYGVKNSQLYLKIHWANKIVFLFIGMTLIALIGSTTKVDAGYAVFSISLLIGILYLTDSELNKKIKKRRMAIKLGFPYFLNKMTLLVNAGMTISRAWEKISQDKQDDNPLYNEVRLTVSEINAGKPEARAYEDFAKRCRLSEVSRFVSVVLQNMKKGNSEVVSILRVMSNECWENRKNVARKLGEEASTKMILPLMLMFLAILLIVSTPAVLSLRGF